MPEPAETVNEPTRNKPKPARSSLNAPGTQAYVRECLSYDRETGLLAWKERPREHYETDVGVWTNRGRAGRVAGSLRDVGYARVGLDGVQYPAARLIWFMETGHWPQYPEEEIEHIDHIRANNQWSNLRLVGRLGNAKNRTRSVSNTSGYMGVCTGKRGYRAYAQIDRVRHCLGTYATKEEAASVAAKFRSDRGLIDAHGAAPQPQVPHWSLRDKRMEEARAQGPARLVRVTAQGMYIVKDPLARKQISYKTLEDAEAAAKAIFEGREPVRPKRGAPIRRRSAVAPVANTKPSN